MRRPSLRRTLGATLIALALEVGCAGGTVVDLARQGDLAGVKRELTLLVQSQGTLDRALVEQLSRATVVHDLRTAEPEQAVRLVEAVSPCGRVLAGELRERSKGNDDAAADATRVLLDNGKLSPDAVIQRTRRSSSDAWRAAFARALVRPGWGEQRRKLIKDADERVRRGALKAAATAKDPDDLRDLLEASRLDPDAKSRRLALEAVGALGGARVALTLRDNWAQSDSDTRLAIVDAWAAPRIYAAGGSRELVWAAEAQDSREAVAAAAALARLAPPTARTSDGTKTQGLSVIPRELGRVLIAQFVREGSVPERTYAIELADPADPLAREALDKAVSGDEKVLRVAALARLVDVEAERSKALERLRQLCTQKDDVGRAAREALVHARDTSVVPLLIAALSSKKAEIRAAAAEDLVKLGQQSVAATALTDESAEVRIRTACAVASAGD